MTSSDADNKRLGVHVIGAGFGESIVLEFPRKTFGVIDCCCSTLNAPTEQERLRSNPTLRFLVEELRAQSLEFVAITHPHEDHARGMSHILNHYAGQINQIWCFATLENSAHLNFFKGLVDKNRQLPVEKLLGESRGTFYRELYTIRQLVRQAAKRDSATAARREFFFDFKDIHLTSGSRVRFLGPRGSRVVDYTAKLNSSIESGVDQDSLQFDSDWKPNTLRHNEVSPALLVEFGETKLLLGGDMEVPSWQEVLEYVKAKDDLSAMKCSLLKIGHHGSETGYCDDLADWLSSSHKPLAILTPFNRHKRPLPRQEGIDKYRAHVSEILTTNLRQTLHKPSKPSEASIEQWRHLISRNPDWLGASDPNVIGEASDVSPLEKIPKALTRVLVSKPALKAVLRPEFRQVLPTPKLVEEGASLYRVSYYFDRAGNLLSCEPGKGAGRI